MNILESHIIVFGADRIDIYNYEIDIWLKDILLFQYVSDYVGTYYVRNDYFDLTESFPALYHDEDKWKKLKKEVLNIRILNSGPHWLKLHNKNNRHE